MARDGDSIDAWVFTHRVTRVWGHCGTICYGAGGDWLGEDARAWRDKVISRIVAARTTSELHNSKLNLLCVRCHRIFVAGHAAKKRGQASIA